jgi:hypothetical protein
MKTASVAFPIEAPRRATVTRACNSDIGINLGIW